MSTYSQKAKSETPSYMHNHQESHCHLNETNWELLDNLKPNLVQKPSLDPFIEKDDIVKSSLFYAIDDVLCQCCDLYSELGFMTEKRSQDFSNLVMKHIKLVKKEDYDNDALLGKADEDELDI